VNIDLQAWINEASWGLELTAREKISEQITEHYEEAVRHYRSSGLDAVEAHWKALEDLGDWGAARAKYEKLYFPVISTKTKQLRKGLSILYIIYALWLLRFPPENDKYAIVFAIYMILGLVFDALSDKMREKENHRAIGWLHVISIVLAISFLIITYFHYHERAYFWICQIVMIIFCPYAIMQSISEAKEAFSRARASTK
jgi:hypothetical protein